MPSRTISRNAVLCLKNALAHTSRECSEGKHILHSHVDIHENFCSSFLNVNIIFVRNNKGVFEKYKELNNYFIATSNVSLPIDARDNDKSIINCANEFYGVDKTIGRERTEPEIIEFCKGADNNIKMQHETINNKLSFRDKVLRCSEEPDEEMDLGNWPGSIIRFEVESLDNSDKLRIRRIDVTANDMSYTLDEKMLEYIERKLDYDYSRDLSNKCYKNEEETTHSCSALFLALLMNFHHLMINKINYGDSLAVIKYLKLNAQSNNIKAILSIYWDALLVLSVVMHPFQSNNPLCVNCFVDKNQYPIKLTEISPELNINKPIAIVFDMLVEYTYDISDNASNTNSETVPHYQVLMLDSLVSPYVFPFLLTLKKRFLEGSRKNNEGSQQSNVLLGLDSHPIS